MKTSNNLNFHFQHSLSQKKGIIYDMNDRVLFLSHPKFNEKNLKKAILICYRIHIFHRIEIVELLSPT